MEALLQREGDVDSWNDERLDEMSRRMDDGFKEVNARFNEVNARFSEVDARFGEVNARLDQMATREELQRTGESLQGDLRFLSSRFDKLQNTLLIVGGGLMGTVIASTVALITTLG